MLSLPPPITAIFLLFTIFNLHHSTAKAAIITSSKCHPDDAAGLLAFKSGIKSDPSGLLKTWKAGTNCCAWSGVTCQDQQPDRVMSLNVTGEPGNPKSGLSGTISPELSKLQFLEAIYILNHPMLTGPFPRFVYNLPNLIYMYLENNGLSGPIPEDIGKMTRLQAFSVQWNNFSGPIPNSVGQLTELIQLKLGGNRLTGNIPDAIKNLKNMKLLSLDNNQLTGVIPDIFSDLILSFLHLSHNKLTGTIPGSLSALDIRTLDLAHNALTGQIPDFVGKFLTLMTLDLSWNQFSGVVPKSFAQLGNITNLDLSHNSLVDPFPVMSAKAAEHIESVDLSYNQFHLGSMPSFITSAVTIESVKLVKCGLNFNLDDWKPDLGFFENIDLSDNEITGSPLNLLKNKESIFVTFNVSGNKLKFNFENLMFREKLKELDLSRNLVYGKVPRAVSGLQKLNVSKNHLCGELPKTQFPASAFAGNDCLCGSPLSSCKS